MKTEFETKLDEISQNLWNAMCASLNHERPCPTEEDIKKELKTLVADTLLKAIGEDEDPHWEDITRDSRGIAVKNQWKYEIKANVFEALGIKEKSL